MKNIKKTPIHPLIIRARFHSSFVRNDDRYTFVLMLI